MVEVLALRVVRVRERRQGLFEGKTVVPQPCFVVGERGEQVVLFLVELGFAGDRVVGEVAVVVGDGCDGFGRRPSPEGAGCAAEVPS